MTSRSTTGRGRFLYGPGRGADPGCGKKPPAFVGDGEPLAAAASYDASRADLARCEDLFDHGFAREDCVRKEVAA